MIATRIAHFMRRCLTGSDPEFVFRSAVSFVPPYIDKVGSLAMREPWPSEVAM